MRREIAHDVVYISCLVLASNRSKVADSDRFTVDIAWVQIGQLDSKEHNDLNEGSWKYKNNFFSQRYFILNGNCNVEVLFSTERWTATLYARDFLFAVNKYRARFQNCLDCSVGRINQGILIYWK